MVNRYDENKGSDHQYLLIFITLLRENKCNSLFENEKEC